MGHRAGPGCSGCPAAFHGGSSSACVTCLAAGGMGAAAQEDNNACRCTARVAQTHLPNMFQGLLNRMPRVAPYHAARMASERRLHVCRAARALDLMVCKSSLSHVARRHERPPPPPAFGPQPSAVCPATGLVHEPSRAIQGTSSFTQLVGPASCPLGRSLSSLQGSPGPATPCRQGWRVWQRLGAPRAARRRRRRPAAAAAAAAAHAWPVMARETRVAELPSLTQWRSASPKAALNLWHS